MKAQRRKPTTGVEGLIGESGDVIETLKLEGVVRVHGELWNAKIIVQEQLKKEVVYELLKSTD